MDTRIRQGRRILLLVIATCLLLSVSTILSYNLVLGPGKIVPQVVRFLLTALLCVFLYRGKDWARWLFGLLYGHNTIYAFTMGIPLLSQSLWGLMILFLGVLYLLMGVILFFSPSVRAFLTAQREREPVAIGPATARYRE